MPRLQWEQQAATMQHLCIVQLSRLRLFPSARQWRVTPAQVAQRGGISQPVQHLGRESHYRKCMRWQTTTRESKQSGGKKAAKRKHLAATGQQRRERTWATPALLACCFCIPQLPVARLYRSPLVMILLFKDVKEIAILGDEVSIDKAKNERYILCYYNIFVS